MTETQQLTPTEIRELAAAESLRLFVLVHPDACAACATHRGMVYAVDEAPLLPLEDCREHRCRCVYRLFDHAGPTLHEMLALGIAAVKSRKTEEAQDWLVKLLQIDRFNEQAWLWLSGAADDDQDRLDCIHEVLKINPDNAVAQRGLAALQAKGIDLPPG